MSSRIDEKEKARSERAAKEAAEVAKARKARRLWIVGGTVLLALVAVGLAVALSGGSKDSASKGGPLEGAKEANALFAGVPQKGITLGDPKAPVTLVLFGDLQCPFCRDFNADVLPTVVEDYVRAGKVKIDFSNLSFIGPDSVTAAKVAAAAGAQNKLWQFADVFYRNQGTEGSGYVTQDFLRSVAASVNGLDVDKVMAAQGDAASQKQLDEADAEAQTNSVTSTPTVLGGKSGGTLKPLSTASLDELKPQIDALLRQ